MPEEEFWLLTLRELSALLERIEVGREWTDYHYGLVCSVLCNINRDPKKGKSFTPQDFMLTGTSKKQQRKQTLEDMLAMVKVWQAMFDSPKRKK